MSCRFIGVFSTSISLPSDAPNYSNSIKYSMIKSKKHWTQSEKAPSAGQAISGWYPRDVPAGCLHKLDRNLVVASATQITIAWGQQGSTTMGFSQKIAAWKGLILMLKEFIQRYGAPRATVSVSVPPLTDEIVGHVVKESDQFEVPGCSSYYPGSTPLEQPLTLRMANYEEVKLTGWATLEKRIRKLMAE